VRTVRIGLSYRNLGDQPQERYCGVVNGEWPTDAGRECQLCTGRSEEGHEPRFDIGDFELR